MLVASRLRRRCWPTALDADPRIVGSKINGDLSEGVTATDLVLTVTEQLRRHGVVDKFVEFCGPGQSTAVPLKDTRHDREHVTGVRVDNYDLPDR